MVNDVLVGGAGLKKKVENTKYLKADIVELDNSKDIKMIGKALDVGFDVIKERQYIENEKNKLIADEALNRYREALYNVNNPNEFDVIAKSSVDDIKNYFNKSEDGSDFWNKYGGSLMEKNNQDIKNIRLQKEYDFGRKYLNQLLVDNQNILVRADKKRAGILFDEAINNIEKTSFLSDEEKKIYKDEYIKKGVLNVALNDCDTARNLADKFLLEEDKSLYLKIDEIEKIKKDEDEENVRKNNEIEVLEKIKKSSFLWQDFQNGKISKAQYAVLSDGMGIEKEYAKKVNSDSLVNAYLNVKRMCDEGLDVNEIKDTFDCIVDAYNQKNISLDDAIFLQNSMFDFNNVLSGFDNEFNKFLDSVLISDFNLKGTKANDVMKNKVKVALSMHKLYGEKVRELADKYKNEGGEVSEYNIQKLKKEAINDIKNDMSFKENVEGVLSFSKLNSILKQYYRGVNDNVVWERYFNEAPYVEDKKGLLIKIASQEQSLELSYPKFDNWAEVEASDLGVGDKFYYRGRLAVKQV